MNLGLQVRAFCLGLYSSEMRKGCVHNEMCDSQTINENGEPDPVSLELHSLFTTATLNSQSQPYNYSKP